MEEQDKIKAIEDLLGGELGQEEQAKLRLELDKDPEMQKLLANEEELVAGIKQWSRNELRAKLRELESRMEPIDVNEAPKTSKNNWRPLLVAASVTIMVGLYFVFNSINPSTDALYNQYYEPYQSYAPVIKRGGEAAGEDQMNEALKAYESGEYDKAAEQLEALSPGDDRDFYLAHSYMALDEHEKALPLLEQLAETGTEPKSTVSWYLALAYLKNGSTDEASILLTELANYDNTYQKRAGELLKDL